MDLRWDRLNSGEQIAGGAALALFACMFLGWFNFGFVTQDAWEALHFISPVLTVVVVFTLAAVGMKAAGKSLGEVPADSVIFVLGCLAFILVLFRLIDPVSIGGEGFEESASVEAGIFLALLASAGIAGGGYLATGGAGLDQLKKLIPQGHPMPPPPPPQAPPGPVSPPPAATPAPTPAAAPAPPPPPPPAPVPTVEEQGRFCEQCGTAVVPGDRFCSECGATQAPTPG